MSDKNVRRYCDTTESNEGADGCKDNLRKMELPYVDTHGCRLGQGNKGRAILEPGLALKTLLQALGIPTNSGMD